MTPWDSAKYFLSEENSKQRHRVDALVREEGNDSTQSSTLSDVVEIILGIGTWMFIR